MPDYQKMYLTLFRATEETINRLIAAQRVCEEMYISSQEPEIAILPHQKATETSTDKE